MEQRIFNGIVITILIAVIIIFCIGLYISIYLFVPIVLLKILAVLLGTAAAGCLVYVCIRRIQEIREENPDDISKY